MQPDTAEELLEGYIDRYLSGKADPPDQFVAAHPELAGVLKRRLVALGALNLLEDAQSSAGTLPKQFDGYELRGVLGRGGMGTVFDAWEPALKRPVAIKVIAGLGALSVQARERFRREVVSLARIRHPNVVTVYGSGVVAGTPYIAMQHIEGRSLAEWLPTSVLSSRNEIRERVSWIARIARALEHLHERGIVHRDIKPSNVLLGANGNPVLIDFGLARDLSEESLTATGDMVGTLAYTAPEQARGERVDGRADAYGLGATLYHLLLGRPPHVAGSLSELLSKLEAGRAPAPRSLGPKFPRDLAVVLEHAVEPDSRMRYASCADLAEDLEAVLAGRPIAVRPVSRLERLARWTRRHPATVIACSSALIALGLLVVLFVGRRKKALELEFHRNFQIADALLIADDGTQENRERNAARRVEALARLSRCEEIHPRRKEVQLRITEAALRLDDRERAKTALARAEAAGAAGFYLNRLRHWLDPASVANPTPLSPEHQREVRAATAIDRMDMAYMHLNLERGERGKPQAVSSEEFVRSRFAYELLDDLDLTGHDLLSPEVLMGIGLYENLMHNPENMDAWVFRDPHHQCRRALECLDKFLERVPDAQNVRFHRFILIRECVNHDVVLGDMDELRSWAETYLADRMLSEPGPAAIGAAVSYWWTLFKKNVDRDRNLVKAESLVDSLPPGGLPELDALEYEAVIACLIVRRRYADALERLHERGNPKAGTGPLDVVAGFHRTFADALPFVEPDVRGLRAFLERTGPEEDPQDLAAALAEVENFSRTIYARAVLQVVLARATAAFARSAGFR